MLATIAAPSAGEVRLDGELLRRDRIDLRRRLFFLPDTPYVLYGTAIRHIGMVLRLYEADRPAIEERVLELLREFDLLPLANVRLGGLSRGELYKAALVALIAADPEVWLFDEPFASGMNPHGIAALRNQAKAAVARGRTVIYSTQIMEVAERFSDRVCILHKGRVEALDSVDRLARQAGERVTCWRRSWPRCMPTEPFSLWAVSSMERVAPGKNASPQRPGRGSALARTVGCLPPPPNAVVAKSTVDNSGVGVPELLAHRACAHARLTLVCTRGARHQAAFRGAGCRPPGESDYDGVGGLVPDRLGVDGSSGVQRAQRTGPADIGLVGH